MTEDTPKYLFEKRALELAQQLGIEVDEYSDLDELHRDFFESIGYQRVCSMMVIADLKRGRSERVLARKYSLTRRQIQTIKGNSCLGNRRKPRVL